MGAIESKSKETHKKAEVIDFLLSSLEEQLREMGDKIQAAKSLREIGEKDSLAQKIEEIFDHPLDSYSELSDRIAQQLKSLINFKITSELAVFNDKISHLWLLKDTGDDLHYVISLKENTFKIRDSIREIAVSYQLKNISDRHNVVFQFVDIEHEESLFSGAMQLLDESISE